ncbi:MAG: hypothetical protein WDM90_14280 [Ferruginibacter sp.]
MNEPKVEVSSPDNKPFFQLVLKTNGDVYYSYDSTDMNRNLILVDQPTKEKLIQVLSKIELQHNIKPGDEQVIN